MTFRADLHCHTNYSDGSDDPITLLKKAKEVGLSGLSITDHDCIDAYTDEVLAFAQSLEIRILPGIEISSSLYGNTVHILGYGFDLKSSSLLDVIGKTQEKRRERNRLILEKLSQKKKPISEKELWDFVGQKTGRVAHQVIGRPHIAALMIEKGYVSSFQEAFDLYLKDRACCYVAGFRLTPLEVVQAIHQARGRAVLAHPHFIKEKRILRDLLVFPFDGIECYYGTLDKHLEKPWLDLAKKKGWLPTGGSDYHGLIRPNVALGASWVSLDIFESLFHER